MPEMGFESDSDAMLFEETRHEGILLKRIGKLKTTGTTVQESRYDERQRQIENIFFDDRGQFTKRVVYEYDEERRPRLTTVFDKSGNVIMRHERGKTPEFFQ
jgi:hypothetical protein